MINTQKQELLKLLKANEVLVDTTTVKTGEDIDGFPVFETRFEKPPKNYKLVRLIEPLKGAILEDLDYKEGASNEAKSNA